MKTSFIVFVAQAVCAYGLVLTTKTKEPNVPKCPQQVEPKMWGLWIDGRHADKGEHGYDHLGTKEYTNYGKPVMKALQLAHDKSQKNRQEGNGEQASSKSYTEFFMAAKKHLAANWRQFRNPVHFEVRACHKELPKQRVTDILDTVSLSVMDKKYKPVFTETTEYKNILLGLFDTYHDEVNSKPGRKKELLALATLLQNLAYLHPLEDFNGRSRLVLMTFLLRERGLACGTMMYNNNKNIYFMTAEEMAEHIEEGIEKYNEAAAHDFASNPWQSEEARNLHYSKFPKAEYSEALNKCWKSKIGETAKGTSPELVDKKQISAEEQLE